MFTFLKDLLYGPENKYTLQVKRKNMTVMGQWHTYAEYSNLGEAIKKAGIIKDAVGNLGYSESRVLNKKGEIVWSKK